MTTIHMETEQVRNVARQLDQWAANLLSSGAALRSTSGRLSIAWQGGRSESFLSNFRTLMRNYEMQVQQLQNLALRVSREVDEWQSADSTGTSAWKDLGRFAPAILVAGSTVPFLLGQTQEKFDWFKPSSEVIKGALKILKKVPYDSELRQSWKGIGRLINAAGGNLKGGWVGRMDGLGHIIKSPAVQKLAPYGLGVAGDLLKGDRWDHAFGSEAIETAAEWGLPMAIGGAIGGIIGGVAGAAAGGGGAIPGAAAGAAAGAMIGVAVYAVYQSALAIGSIFAAGLQIGGANNEAIWLQNTVDKWDFGENIGNGVYDGIYNYATGEATSR